MHQYTPEEKERIQSKFATFLVTGCAIYFLGPFVIFFFLWIAYLITG